MAKEFTIPPVITKTRFEEFMGKLDKKEVDLIKQYYKKYDINKLTPKDNKDELIANYPIIESEVIYVLRSATKENVRKTIQDKFEAAGYTYDDYLADKELDLSSSSSELSLSLFFFLFLFLLLSLTSSEFWLFSD